jgi:hypothetical protein
MITGPGDIVDLTDVTIETDTRCHEVDHLAWTVSLRVRERVWDARRRGPEVARTQLHHVVAELDGQDAVDDEEGVFLCGVDVQVRAGTVRDIRNEEVESAFVVAAVRLPRPLRSVPQHISVHGSALPFRLTFRLSFQWGHQAEPTFRRDGVSGFVACASVPMPMSGPSRVAGHHGRREPRHDRSFRHHTGDLERSEGVPVGPIGERAGRAQLGVVAAAGRPARRGDGDRQPASAFGAEARGVERAATAGALGAGPATAGAVGGTPRIGTVAPGVDHRRAQMAAVRAPMGMRRSSSIWRSSSAERPSVVR